MASSSCEDTQYDLQEEVRDLLGGPRVLKSRKTRQEMIAVIRKGFPAQSVSSLTKKTHIDEDHILALVDVSSRTLARRRERLEPLSPAQSDRLYRLAHIVARATQVLGARDTAVRWLQTPNAAVGAEPPLAIVDTEIGFQQIKDVLGRIEHGVYT